jgi:PAS domain S-box-containing protein
MCEVPTQDISRNFSHIANDFGKVKVAFANSAGNSRRVQPMNHAMNRKQYPPDKESQSETLRLLLEAEQRFRNLFDYASEAIVVLDVDSGKFIDANHKAEQIFGLDKDTLLEMGPFALSPATQPSGPSSEQGEERISEAIKGHNPIFEWWHCNSLGERFPCEVRLVRVPWGDHDAVRGSIVDISDRKLLELSELSRRRIQESVDRRAPLQETLDGLIHTVEYILPGVIGSILLLDLKNNCLRLGAAPNLPEFFNDAVDGLPLGPKVGSCGAAVYGGRRVIVSDISTHENWEGFRELAARAGVSACWSQPIFSLSGEVLGAFALYYKEPSEPAPVELMAIESAAHAAAVVIEHTSRQSKSAADVAALQAARVVQKALFPEQSPIIPNMDLAGAVHPADRVSGDYFDYLKLRENLTGFLVADVSGHGLGPGLVMAQMHGFVRALSDEYDDPAKILWNANKLLWSREGEYFVTAFLALFNSEKQTLTYASAGHQGYLFCANGIVKTLESTGLPLGVVEDWQSDSTVEIPLQTGEIVLVPTDGTEEAHSLTGDRFGRANMLEVIRGHADLTASQIVDVLFTAVRNFGEGMPQEDDITAVVAKVLPKK